MKTRKEIIASLKKGEGNKVGEARISLHILEVLLDIRKLVIIGINRFPSTLQGPRGERILPIDRLCEECGGFMVQTRVYPDRGDSSPTELKCPQCEKKEEGS